MRLRLFNVLFACTICWLCFDILKFESLSRLEASFGWEQDPKGQVRSVFYFLDANADGEISEAEWIAADAKFEFQDFVFADLDENRTVSKKELSEWMRTEMERNRIYPTEDALRPKLFE